VPPSRLPLTFEAGTAFMRDRWRCAHCLIDSFFAIEPPVLPLPGISLPLTPDENDVLGFNGEAIPIRLLLVFHSLFCLSIERLFRADVAGAS